MSFEFSSANPCRVLVADKSSGVRSLIRRVLECAGAVFIIDEAETVATAMDRVERNPVHLAYIGANLSAGASLDVVQNMATRWTGLRSILMVDNLTPDLLRRGRSAGVSTFLTKPFYPAQVEHAFDLVFEELAERTYEPLSIADLEAEMTPVVPDEAAFADFRQAARG